MTAPRSVHRPVVRRLGAAIAVGLGLGVVVSPAYASEAVASPAPRAARPVPVVATGPVTEPQLDVTGIEPVELVPDGRVTVTGTVRTAGAALSGVSVAVRRTSVRVATRSAVDAWLQPPVAAPGTRLVAVNTVTLDTVGPSATVPFTVEVDAASAGLPRRSSAAGPYGLLVELTGTPDGGQAAVLGTARGFLVWSPPLDVTPVEFGVVAVLPTLRADVDTGLVDPLVVEAQAGGRGVLRNALDVAGSLPATWTVDPLLLASATVDGAGPRTRAWLADLAARRGAREVVLDTWGRPDPEVLAAGNDDAAMRRMLDDVRERARPGGRALNAEVSLGGPVRTDVTVAGPGIGIAGLASLAAAGQAVVIGDSAVPLVDGTLTFTPDQRADLDTPSGPVRALVTDTGLTATLTAAVGGDALSLTTLIAQLSATVLQRPNDQRTLGAVLVDPGSGDPDAAAATERALTGSSWVRTIGVGPWLDSLPSPLARAVPGPVGQAEATEIGQRAGAIKALLVARRDVESLGEAVATPRQGEWALNRRCASAVSLPVAEITGFTAQLAEQAAAWQAGVRIIPPSGITLAASESSVPLTVINEIDTEVTLWIEVVSRSPRLRVSAVSQKFVLAGGEMAALGVPVQAVSNGRAQLVVRLLTESGTAWGPPADIDVRVATGAETGVLGVIAVLTSVGFVVGTIRTIRRSRRRREPETLQR